MGRVGPPRTAKYRTGPSNDSVFQQKEWTMPMVSPPSAPMAFTFPETAQQVRSMLIDGEPWFVGKDACDVVGISKYRDALAQLDDDERVSAVVDTPGGAQRMALVSEPGVYALMLISRSPRVKPFRRWVTHEVIPQIRKTGRYETAPVPRREPSKLELARDLVSALEAQEAAEARVKELEAPAAAWNVLADASGDYSLRDAAHILNRDPNIATGQHRLMKFIRDLGMVDRKGVPYAKHSAHLVERPQTYLHPQTREVVLAKPQIRITVRGLQYLHGKLGGVAPLRYEQSELDAA